MKFHLLGYHNSYSHRNASFFTFIFLSLLIHVFTSSIAQTKYNWEDLDYYEILGLTCNLKNKASPRRRRKCRAGIKQTDIRKAYRKQAQKYHPDKFVQQQMKNNSSDTSSASTNKTMTGKKTANTDAKNMGSIEEANAFFFRLTEAYETLNDEKKREEYDLYLSEMKIDENRYENTIKSWVNNVKSFFNGQKTALEDFSFRWHPKNNNVDTWWDSYDSDSSWYSNTYTYSYPNNPKNTNFHSRSSNNDNVHYNREHEQPEIYEYTETTWDHDLRQEIFIVYRREVWLKSGRFITTAQNFVRDAHGSRYSNDEVYIPISNLYVVDEGILENIKPLNQDCQSNEDKTMGNDESILYQGEYLYPGEMMYSANDQFFLLLTNDCELLILSHDFDNNEDTIIWRSDSFLEGLSSQCFLSLYSSQLVLFAGIDLNHFTTIIWSSSNSAISREENGHYFARLDNDGVLAVYRIRQSRNGCTNHDTIHGEMESKTFSPISWLEKTLQRNRQFRHSLNQQRYKKTKASKVWNQFQDWTLMKLKNRKEFDTNICIWASGPFGCFSSGRKAIRIGSSVQRSIQKAVGKMDTMLDRFIEDLSDDDDMDILDTLERLVIKLGVSMSNKSMNMARRGILEGEIMTRVVRDTFRERMRRWSKSFR